MESLKSDKIQKDGFSEKGLNSKIATFQETQKKPYNLLTY